MEHGSPSSNHNRSTKSSSEGEEVQIPIVHLARIMRRALPLNAKIKNSAKESIQWCASEFMGIITTQANERCKAENRKIVTAIDLILAMERFGFDDYVGPLKLYLKNYRGHKDRTIQTNGIPIKFGFNKNGFDASGSNKSNANGQR